jgi:hypothetical protein
MAESQLATPVAPFALFWGGRSEKSWFTCENKPKESADRHVFAPDHNEAREVGSRHDEGIDNARPGLRDRKLGHAEKQVKQSICTDTYT